MTVLILARQIEPQVDRVVEELTARQVPVFRTDLAAFPQALTLDARLAPDGWTGMLATERRAVSLRDVRSIWYRHPSHLHWPRECLAPNVGTRRRRLAWAWPGCSAAWTCSG